MSAECQHPKLSGQAEAAHREPMTPGQLALREAARLEAAKVYSRVQREHRQGRQSQPVEKPDDIEVARRRRVLGQIA